MLTSSSTISDVLDQYNNNLLWEGDVTKARAVLEAIRWLLVNRPKLLAESGRSMSYGEIESEKKRIEDFLAVAGSSRPRCSFTRGVMLT